MQKHFSFSDIMNFEQRFRATFVNSLGGFKSVCLIGTKNLDNQSNLAIFSSIVHIGANPPLMGFVVRLDATERHTLENILATSTFTLNHIHADIYEKAHQTSARYARNVSEFEAVGLTEIYKNNFFAPFVAESHIQIGLEFREKIDFTINGTSFIIGQIKEVYFPEQALQIDGFLDLSLAKTITCSGLDSYHTTTSIARLPYAKVP
jgi:flavin reductase (DIM6/NTAB) family NADH-FMN oxidoreductase RutF